MSVASAAVTCNHDGPNTALDPSPLPDGILQASGSSRDLLLLDIALESWLRMLIERQDKRDLSGDDLVELMELVLGNAALTGDSDELQLVYAQWEAVRTYTDRWSRAWCLAASAALARVTLAMSAFADEICGLVQVGMTMS